jgi:mannose-6-phosphate isomerase-like protein (cupin superfamily)
MKKIVINRLIDEAKEKWIPQDVCFVNETALRICKVEGAYDWHTHQEEDEFFLVVKGHVFIDTEEGSVELNENEGFVVRKGLRHRSRTEGPAWVLLVEPTRTKTLGR